MRNCIGILAAGMILLGMVGFVFFGGILDTPGMPITPAIYVGIASLALFGGGGLLGNLYEKGGRKSV